MVKSHIKESVWWRVISAEQDALMLQDRAAAAKRYVSGVIGEFTNTEVRYQESCVTIKAMQIDLLLIHSLLPHLNGQNRSAEAIEVDGLRILLSMKKL